MRKILIFGRNGQLASDLIFATNSCDDFSCDVVSSKDIDLSKTEELANFIKKLPDYDIVINATAYNLVDKAEEDFDMAEKINKDAVKIIADFCKKTEALFIHFSTNYVFDGKNPEKNKENDSDFIKPLGKYGQSKLDGEIAVAESGCDYLIFRLSTVFRENKTNFITKMLELFEKHQELKIVNDQITNPSYSFDIANAVIEILRKIDKKDPEDPRLNQIYHMANDGETSYFEFCKFIYEQVKNNPSFTVVTKNISGIETSSYPTPAQRPLNGVMNLDKLKENFDISLPTWQDATKRVIQKSR